MLITEKVIKLYGDKIYLTPKEILDKEFKIDAKGYRPQEVDKFLDMIIRDYTEFINIIKRSDKERKELLKEISDLKEENRILHDKLELANDTNNSNSGTSNVDILRRISQLEKVVFGKLKDQKNNIATNAA